jgi:hypothetical protein
MSCRVAWGINKQRVVMDMGDCMVGTVVETCTVSVP